jgi:WD40 repeat protein
LVTVWSVRSGKCIKSIDISSDNIHGIAPTMDKSRIVIACRDLLDNIRIYDIGTGRHVKSLYGHANTVFSIDVSADCKLLASGSADHTVKIWDLESGKCMRTLTAHSDWVEAVRFSYDGNLLLTGGCDAAIRLWEVRTGKLLREFTGFGYNVYSLDMSPDNLRVVAAGNDKSIHVWDAGTGRIQRDYRGNDYQLYKVVFAPGSDTFLTGGKKTFRQWRLGSALGFKETMGYTNAVCAMAANSYTRELVIGCWEFGAKKINYDTGEIAMHYASTMSSVYAVVLSHSGERLATGGRSMLTNLLDAKTGKQLRWLEHKDNVNALAIGIKADVLYTACSDGIARKWDVSSSACITLFEGHAGRITNCALSKDETTLYTGGADACIRAWNTENGRCRRIFSEHTDEVNALVLSWNERYLASGGRDGTVVVRDTVTGVRMNVLRIGVEVTALACGPLDETILIGCNDGSIFVYNLSTGSLVRLAGHTSRVSAIVFLEETSCIVSSSYDGTLKFRSNDTGILRATFYNLDRGYLWSTPRDEESESGWIWTDRPALVGVVECEKDGADPRALGEGDDERARFLTTISNKAKVIQRLRGAPATRGAAARRTRHAEPERKLLE